MGVIKRLGGYQNGGGRGDGEGCMRARIKMLRGYRRYLLHKYAPNKKGGMEVIQKAWGAVRE